MTIEENKKRLEEIRKLPIKRTTWEEIYQFIKDIPQNNYVGVYGIPRAGKLIAILYSYYYDIPILDGPCKNCLVIDDDIGTGLTIEKYTKKYYVAVMFSNKKTNIKPQYIWKYYEKDCFRKFPWDK